MDIAVPWDLQIIHDSRYQKGLEINVVVLQAVCYYYEYQVMPYGMGIIEPQQPAHEELPLTSLQKRHWGRESFRPPCLNRIWRWPLLRLINLPLSRTRREWQGR